MRECHDPGGAVVAVVAHIDLRVRVGPSTRYSLNSLQLAWGAGSNTSGGAAGALHQVFGSPAA